MFFKALVYAFPAVTFSLGTWQVIRWQNKKDFKARLRSALYSATSPPLRSILQSDPILKKRHDANDPNAKTFGKEVEFQKVTVEGAVISSYAVGPRVNNGENGYRLISMVKITDGNSGSIPEVVAVDRGWFKGKETLVPDQTRFEGIIRRAERATWYHSKPNSRERNQYTALIPGDFDSNAYSQFYVQELEMPSDYASLSSDSQKRAPTLVRPSVEQAAEAVYDKHIEYIVTWWGLSGASLAMLIARRRQGVIKHALRK